MFIKTNKKLYDLTKRTHIMGILNVTPDSFSDGGLYSTKEKALEEALKMEADGADIIDVGGESTRPSPDKVSEKARLAIEAGADIINDVWGAKKDPQIAKVAAEYNVPIVLMHNRNNKNYTNLIEDMISDLNESINIATEAGVMKENIILDPGV